MFIHEYLLSFEWQFNEKLRELSSSVTFPIIKCSEEVFVFLFLFILPYVYRWWLSFMQCSKIIFINQIQCICGWGRVGWDWQTEGSYAIRQKDGRREMCPFMFYNGLQLFISHLNVSQMLNKSMTNCSWFRGYRSASRSVYLLWEQILVIWKNCIWLSAVNWVTLWNDFGRILAVSHLGN